MKKFFFFFSFSLLVIKLNCQSSDTRPAYSLGFNVSGPNAVLNYIYQFQDVKGTAFWDEDWQTANVVLNSGYIFKAVRIKLDAYNNKFIFNRNDSSFELPDNVKAVIVFPAMGDTSKKIIYQKGIQINALINANKFVQVLAEGKTALYKYVKKDIENYTEYGNANNFQRFVELQQYYFFDNGQYFTTTISKKNFEKLLKGKSAALDNFIKQKSLSGKEEKDWVESIDYYNNTAH